MQKLISLVLAVALVLVAVPPLLAAGVDTPGQPGQPGQPPPKPGTKGKLCDERPAFEQVVQGQPVPPGSTKPGTPQPPGKPGGNKLTPDEEGALLVAQATGNPVPGGARPQPNPPKNPPK